MIPAMAARFSVPRWLAAAAIWVPPPLAVRPSSSMVSAVSMAEKRLSTSVGSLRFFFRYSMTGSWATLKVSSSSAVGE